VKDETSVHAIGYVRVSTEMQTASGLGIEAQTAALRSACQDRGWHGRVVVEDAASGKSMERRPLLAEALEDLHAKRAQVLVVTKVDRLSRSLIDFAGLLARAENEGWKIVVLDVAGLDMTTPTGKFTAHILAANAELERSFISQRTREALAAARADGKRLGRPRTLPDGILRRVVAEREAGSTWQAIADRLNADQVPTARGGAGWRVATVQRVARSARLDDEARAARLQREPTSR
jgi:DNA invertase Pin-like site-specific DNA recombinase